MEKNSYGLVVVNRAISNAIAHLRHLRRYAEAILTPRFRLATSIDWLGAAAALQRGAVAGHLILHSRYVEKLLLTATHLNSNSGQRWLLLSTSSDRNHDFNWFFYRRPLIFSITTKARLESNLKFIELMSWPASTSAEASWSQVPQRTPARSF